MKKITFLLLFISIFGYAKTPITDANIQTVLDLWVSNPNSPQFIETNNTPYYAKISDWDVSQVTNMSQLFIGKTNFNDDISKWDVGNVTTMGYMFYGTSFNGDISAWNMSGVTTMYGMFLSATAFNRDLSAWDVSSVIYMDYMFFGATAFDQNISGWCVSNFESEPYNFSTNSALSDTNKPVWGTCPTASIEDQNQLDVSIHPNPTSDMVYIEGNYTQLKVVIYNILGKEVLSIKNINNINVQALPSGVYTVRISDGVGQTNRKLIKN